MKIRLTGDISGTRNGEQWPARGSVVDLPNNEAATLCAHGMAVPVVEDDTETATAKDTPEKRTRTARRG